jgi:ankyrin repeat protein
MLPYTGDNTPLHIAAKRGEESIVDLLLQMKANPRVKNANGYTAGMLAMESGYPDLANKLKRFYVE